MRYSTYWWGVQITPSKPEDEQRLRDLHAELNAPEACEMAYEDGEAVLIEDGGVVTALELHR